MTSQHSNRKNEHVHLSEKFYDDKRSSLAAIRFVHHSLKAISTAEVSLATQLGDFQLEVPFFINAITGGNEWTGKINRKLAELAKECQLAMAVGSMSIALKDPDLAQSFQVVRQTYPDGLLFANLGAHHSVDNAKRAIDLLDADAIQIHLNSPQEITMPEGDRHFSLWADNIYHLQNELDLPLIVKEVGFGMSKETIQSLEEMGVQYIDISGTGGTNFVEIENYRRKDYKLDELLPWGQSTAESLLEAESTKESTALIASGGIRAPQDILKALALGADAVGMSSQFLHLVIHHDLEECINIVHHWKDELIKTMTILGAHHPSDLRHCDLILPAELVHYAKMRGLDYHHYGKRN